MTGMTHSIIAIEKFLDDLSHVDSLDTPLRVPVEFFFDGWGMLKYTHHHAPNQKPTHKIE